MSAAAAQGAEPCHDDFAACAALVERADPDRFLATMAAPPAARDVLFPLFAANVEVARAPWVTQESMIAEMRLQWWRDAFEEIGKAGVVRRHEVVTPLALAMRAEDAPLLDQLCDARRWDIYKDPFEDFADFEGYLQHTSSNLLLVAVNALGGGAEDVVRDLGYAAGLANFLRAIPALEAAGRVPLLDGRPDAVRDLAAEGLQRLARARKRRGDIAPEAAPALLSGWMAGPVLRRARAVPQAVAHEEILPSEAQRRFDLMWRSLTGRW